MKTIGSFRLIKFDPVNPEYWFEDSIVLDDLTAKHLMNLARKIHPRWLMMIKWNAIFGDQDDVCGGSDDLIEQQLRERLDHGLHVQWDQPQPSGWSLSHCAHAFFDAKLSLDESLRLCNNLHDQDLTNEWLDKIITLRKSGIDVFLLGGVT